MAGESAATKQDVKKGTAERDSGLVAEKKWRTGICNADVDSNRCETTACDTNAQNNDLRCKLAKEILWGEGLAL